MAFKQILEQDMGVLFHVRCLTPMIYIATSDPIETAAGFKETFESERHLLEIVEAVPFEDLPKHVPTRDEIIFVLIGNPGDWFGNDEIVKALGEGNLQLRLDNRYMQRLIFIGPPELTAPKSLQPFIPRIQEGFTLDSKAPQPEPPSEEQLAETKEHLQEVMFKLAVPGATEKGCSQEVKDKVAAVAPLLAHKSLSLIDNTMAQCAIRAKHTLGSNPTSGFKAVAKPFLDNLDTFIAETLNEMHRHNGWPVYEES